MKLYEFKAGDAVPEWLLDAEPLEPGGPRPDIVFSGDCDVIVLPERVIVFTKSGGHQGSITVRGVTTEVDLFAASATVDIVKTWDRITPRGGGEPVASEPLALVR